MPDRLNKMKSKVEATASKYKQPKITRPAKRDMSSIKSATASTTNTYEKGKSKSTKNVPKSAMDKPYKSAKGIVRRAMKSANTGSTMGQAMNKAISATGITLPTSLSGLRKAKPGVTSSGIKAKANKVTSNFKNRYKTKK